MLSSYIIQKVHEYDNKLYNGPLIIHECNIIIITNNMENTISRDMICLMIFHPWIWQLWPYEVTHKLM